MKSIISEFAVLHLQIFSLAYQKFAKFIGSFNRVITTQHFRAKPTDPLIDLFGPRNYHSHIQFS